MDVWHARLCAGFYRLLRIFTDCPMLPLLVALLAFLGAALLYLATPHQPWLRSARTSVLARVSGLITLGLSWLLAVRIWPALTATCYVMAITMAGLTLMPFVGAFWRARRPAAVAP